ncbi:BTB/POZ domain-containing protein 7 [Hetaerina americana]|uniref:BTB/POZ domain-containing protein 7 n=1 Tax=Hetaerina americana TaxID=62018 RepID=UPI003A7F33DE
MGASASGLLPSESSSPPSRSMITPSTTSEHLAGIVRERKKKVTGFATLRKKFIRRRRSSKACDHARVLRELVSDWSGADLCRLLQGYEALAALKDLHVQAELARPPAPSRHRDLARLLEGGQCADVELTFRGARFPAHRAILAARCPRLRHLLASATIPPQSPGTLPQLRLDPHLRHGVDVHLLGALLHFLYTGEPPSHNPSAEALSRLADDFGTPNPLDADLRYLLETGDYADATLVFTSATTTSGMGSNANQCPLASHSPNSSASSSSPSSSAHQPFSSNASPSPQPCSSASGVSCPSTSSQPSAPQQPHSEYGFHPRLELPCHRAILSARSPFFRNVMARRRVGAVPNSSGDDPSCDSQQQQHRGPARIVLDESVIPKRYARVLLHAIYLDTVDLGLILRGANGNGNGSIGEAHALLSSSSASDIHKKLPDPDKKTIGLRMTDRIHLRKCADKKLGCRAGASQMQQQGTGSSCGGNSAAALRPPAAMEEAMELYQIGRFLEVDILSQGCEDLILEGLTVETLPCVLRWGSQPHGSAWVRRQAANFLREEFQTIAWSPVMYRLEKAELAEALNSDFLQASELEVLQAVLRWGEHELIRRMEDREPNLLSHTAHSVSRKGVKKRDLSDGELREIISDLIPLVRVDHVLPPGGNCGSDALSQAIRRGLLSTPPSHMIGGEGGAGGNRADAWVRSRAGSNGIFVRPRLFMPYYEEVKALLEERVAQEAELLRLRRAPRPPHLRDLPDIPDTLYMVEGRPRRGLGVGGMVGGGGNGGLLVHPGPYHLHQQHLYQQQSGVGGGSLISQQPFGSVPQGASGSSDGGQQSHLMCGGAGMSHGSVANHLKWPLSLCCSPSPSPPPPHSGPSSTSFSTPHQSSTVVHHAPPSSSTASIATALPAPDPATTTAMLRREQKLRQAPTVQRALALPLSSRHEILRQIRLRVVREFNLPDPVADFLETASCYCTQDDDDIAGDLEVEATVEASKDEARGGQGNNSGSFGAGRNAPSPFPRLHGSQSTAQSSSPSSAPVGTYQRADHILAGVEGEVREGLLSEVMPDVAMATASFGQLQLQEQELELDLGDGASHPPTNSASLPQLYPHLPHGGPPLLHHPFRPPPFLHHRPSQQQLPLAHLPPQRASPSQPPPHQGGPPLYHHLPPPLLAPSHQMQQQQPAQQRYMPHHLATHPTNTSYHRVGGQSGGSLGSGAYHTGPRFI